MIAYLYVLKMASKENGYLCFHDNQTNVDILFWELSINCSCSDRYVIYFKERRQGVDHSWYYSKYAYNDLCEIEVYGENDFQI